MRKLLLLFISIIAFGSLGKAQDYTYYISTDTMVYMAGAQIEIEQEWSSNNSSATDTPVLADSLGALEKLSSTKVETDEVDGRKIFKRKVVYTAFDTGFYQIRPQAWAAGEDSVYSNPLFITIKLMEVDTAEAPNPIEDPIEVPYTFQELLPYIIGGILAAALIYLLIVLLKRRKTGITVEKKPDIPPYVEAFELLEKLKKEKLWQNGKEKEYHYQLSYILRNYVERRYNTAAIDLTTSELLSLLKVHLKNEKLQKQLDEILKIGDLAKFAKLKPSPDEHEQSWQAIHDFVKETMNPKSEQHA